MIAYVRTTGGSVINLNAVVEAVMSEDNLVTLFIGDGEIRHATREEWNDAIRCNCQHLIPAAPATYLLRHTSGDEVPGIYRVPVLAWLFEETNQPLPITIEGEPDGDLMMPTIMTPDGRVGNGVAHYESYEAWHRSLVRRLNDPDFEQGCGPERAYYSIEGKRRRAGDLDPFI